MMFGPWVQRPAGGQRQVFLQATLDDASRLIPHAQFYPDQGLDSFLDCLRQAISARGSRSWETVAAELFEVFESLLPVRVKGSA